MLCREENMHCRGVAVYGETRQSEGKQGSLGERRTGQKTNNALFICTVRCVRLMSHLHHIIVIGPTMRMCAVYVSDGTVQD